MWAVGDSNMRFYLQKTNNVYECNTQVQMDSQTGSWESKQRYAQVVGR